MTKKTMKIRALTSSYAGITRIRFKGPEATLRLCISAGLVSSAPAILLHCDLLGIAISWQSMLLDYVVAYTLVFLCGFGAGRKLGWLWGTLLGSFGRWVSLTLSGGAFYFPVFFLQTLLFSRCDPASKPSP